ncbi:DUF3168 domain-containing protein [Brucella anthropi]|uniref:DUF3168 domain-containing protein n=1 Tax=Brucella/Ochrobactrum group TaxID=2826938 RepID=UPI00124E2C43|nr:MULTISPECIES: DUF3168 domain-containing protein [Brucella/Ochrobactrum group]KAB2764786.1 DUF3168 domain-containing protein [Brucella anthropi]KAB2782543.1 DUF3168 domain-containing protein [Brucella anthropi]MCQ9143332.1 DUF3168 domain-containing protein [Ochrobactrum sp. BTU2]UGQ23866.1 DUF3168 domain-containing protein [Brucella anthropi]
MSVSVALQDFILAKLLADSTVASLVANRIWDGPQPNPEFPYISIGASEFTPDDADCIDMREETIQIDCWSREQGRKWPCRQIVDAVVNALRHADGDLSNGALVETRINLARVIDDPDGIMAHGIVQFTAIIEG